MPAVLLAAALLAAPSFLPTVAPADAQQNRWQGVNGNNLTRVFHTGGGSFEHDQGGRGLEYGSDGSVIHSFEEMRREPMTVWLIDRSRGGVVVEINLRTGDINGTPAFGRPRLLYRITDADAGGRSRGWRGRRGGGGDGRGPGRRDDDRDGRGNDGWGRDNMREVEVGPIWNQRDAEQKCRAKAAELRVEWTGQWRTTVVGRMSVCQMRRFGGGGYGNNGNNGGYGGGVVRELEVGPIWNQRDAEQKCRAKAQEMRGEWTGQWRTTVQGRMSVCEIRMR